MDEFVDRMSAQRRIVNIINAHTSMAEELCGLTKGAIDRWESSNGLPTGNRVALLLRKASDQLGFLAAQSQDQVTEEYQSIREEIQSITLELQRILRENNGDVST